jgi:hypothetical protein
MFGLMVSNQTFSPLVPGFMRQLLNPFNGRRSFLEDLLIYKVLIDLTHKLHVLVELQF